MKTLARDILEKIKNNYVIIDTEGRGDDGAIDIICELLNSKDDLWEEKIKLYFSKISGSEYEARQKYKEFNNLI